MLRTGLILTAILTAAHSAIADQTIRDIPVDGGATIRCTISTPDGADLKQPIPVIIVFPPGPQTAQMEAAARSMFYAESLKRGWALVTPQPPEGTLFFQKPALFKSLVDDLNKVLVPEGGKYHVAGGSNGGRSAFAFAMELPERTASLAGFPGSPHNKPSEELVVEKLKSIPVRLWVGGDDTVAWIDASKEMQALSQRAKDPLDVTLTIVPGQTHTLRSLTSAQVLDELEKSRRKEGTMPRPALDALAVLDALHAAASKGDFDAYFALYTDDAVFIGTDASERWSLDQFKAYTKPHFDKGKKDGKGGWTYTPRDGARNVTIDPSGTVAFFDELLDNDNYGTTRGTGVLRKITSGEGDKTTTIWRVAQYSLSIPIPNPLAKRVAAMIKAEEKKK